MLRARRTVVGTPLIEATIKEVAKRMRTTAEKLKGKDRYWEMTRNRAPNHNSTAGAMGIE